MASALYGRVVIRFRCYRCGTRRWRGGRAASSFVAYLRGRSLCERAVACERVVQREKEEVSRRRCPVRRDERCLYQASITHAPFSDLEMSGYTC